MAVLVRVTHACASYHLTTPIMLPSLALAVNASACACVLSAIVRVRAMAFVRELPSAANVEYPSHGVDSGG